MSPRESKKKRTTAQTTAKKSGAQKCGNKLETGADFQPQQRSAVRRDEPKTSAGFAACQTKTVVHCLADANTPNRCDGEESERGARGLTHVYAVSRVLLPQELILVPM